MDKWQPEAVEPLRSKAALKDRSVLVQCRTVASFQHPFGELILAEERLLLSGGKLFHHPDVRKPEPPAFPLKTPSKRKLLLGSMSPGYAFVGNLLNKSFFSESERPARTVKAALKIEAQMQDGSVPLNAKSNIQIGRSGRDCRKHLQQQNLRTSHGEACLLLVL